MTTQPPSSEKYDRRNVVMSTPKDSDRAGMAVGVAEQSESWRAEKMKSGEFQMGL
jgi:hypothetical protein